MEKKEEKRGKEKAVDKFNNKELINTPEIKHEENNDLETIILGISCR